MAGKPEDKRTKAAGDMLDEIVAMLDSHTVPFSGDPATEGTKLVELLNRNFTKLDPSNIGITRAKLASALSKPKEFSPDEYWMLYLISKYFRTIADLSDDEPGPDTVISVADKNVLAQFLVHGNMTLEQLHQWFQIDSEKEESEALPWQPGPPP